MTEVMPQRGMLRILRGVVLASVSALLAVGAHVAGGGHAPGGALTVLLVAALALGAAVLADRPRGPVAVLVAVCAVQLLMHLLLTALDHRHGPSDTGTWQPDTMLAAHVLAVLLTTALLARAESVLFAMAAALRRLTRWLLVAPAPRSATALVRLPAPAAGLRRVLFATGLRLRGPPVVS